MAEETIDNKVQNIQQVEETVAKKEKSLLFVIICIASILVAMGIFVLLVRGYINKQYNSFEVTQSYNRQDSNTARYLSANGKLIKYSKDGIEQRTIQGKTIWSGSYNMSNPEVSYCGEYILVADIGGKDAYIYNGKDTGTEIKTDYEIRQGCVSRQGVVALWLQDTTSDTINIYNPYDITSTLLAEIPTNVEDGYPVSIALSPDGTSVVASYLCIGTDKPESRVAFYNFTDVGQNTDCLVGAQNYDNTLITDIQFISDDRVCLFGDAGYYVWDNMKKPSQTYSKKIKKQIKSIFYNKKYIGLILETGKKKYPSCIQVYAMNGKQILNENISATYDAVSFDGEEVLLNNSKRCLIYRINGTKRLDCEVDGGVSYFFCSTKQNRYYLLNDTTIQEVKLTNQ